MIEADQQQVLKDQPERGDLSHCRVIGMLNSIEAFGQEKGNIEVFKAIRSMGAQVHIGVNEMQDGGQVGDLVRNLGFDCFTLPFGCQWSKTFFRREPSLIFKNIGKVKRCSDLLKQQMKRTQATHVHVSNPLAYSYVYRALRRSPVPMVYRMGDEPPHDSRPNLVIWRSCFARSERVVANSQFVRRSILKAVPLQADKLRLIYNLAPSTGTQDDRVQNFAQEDHRATVTDPVSLLYVGQLAHHKGIENLLEAVIKLLEANADITLDIVGRSIFRESYREKLEGIVKAAGYSHKITFHGHVVDPTSRYLAADVLVVPSIFEEPAANVVLEAKKVGIPSVVYPSGGLPELVVHGENGYVCRDKSVAALVEGLSWFVDHPSRIRESRIAALADSRDRFGGPRFDRQWSQVYRETQNAD
jgi:glycosyltransferase involved in cell wall biosynthesis